MIHTVKPGEILSQIARDYRKPLREIIAANRLVNPNLIFPGQKLVIPGFPPAESIPFQITVSVSKRTLTLRRNGQIVKVYPIAVGRILHGTPTGDYIIINKAPNPGGPFGTMWMSLSKEHYGIHGTNDPSSIGKAVSKGCIRMFNKDVEELARTVPVGTPVAIRV
ncbi:L,D-transpeptidase family protein [Bacillus marinisedimentorum]|uniref:L,D-transpeptidase family protein n=1 Tax=Bacillus marinisedimentorum TaxID=1821260 RepID=UPI0007E0F278|nr:L,D-transpeptidase family protein [Bacillus marinisedimentorum]